MKARLVFRHRYGLVDEGTVRSGGATCGSILDVEQVFAAG